MKKILKVALICLVVVLAGVFIWYKIKPSNDTKKLYMSCENKSDNYNVLTGYELSFDKNDACKTDFEVMNVDNTYLKLRANKYFYSLDGNGKINEAKVSQDIFVLANEELVLYGIDKKTKYIFEYK